MHYRKQKRLFYIVYISLIIISISALVSADEVFTNLEVHKEVSLNVQPFNIIDINVLISKSGIELDELYLTGDILGGKLTLGRKYVRSGPGNFSQLMLSDQGTPLNLIMHEGQFTFKDIVSDYRMMIAYLDEDSNKQFFHHRVSNDSLIEGLEIGVSEAMVASENINPAYYLPIPYLPYYLTAYISGLYNNYNSHDDKYLGIDFTYGFDNDIKVYGELLVDEYAQVSYASNPDKRAHLIGIYYPYDEKTELRVEYSNVFNYVYLHRYPQNSYTYKDIYLGHWLGHDGDVVDLELARRLDEDSTVKLGLRYLRRGIGDMETDYGADHQEKKFLSEITTREALLRLGCSRDIRDNVVLDIESEIGRAYLKDGDSEDVFRVNVGLKVEL